MTPVAFLTMDDLHGYYSYDALVEKRLMRMGIKVTNVSWRSQTVNWSDFAMVVIRSPWDYQESPDAFLDALACINASSATLWNPLDVVHWNIQKTYLQTIESAGIDIVPTRFVDSPTCGEIVNAFDHFDTDQIVIKPVLGAGAKHAFWLRRDSAQSQLQAIESVYADRTALLQPFVPSVIDQGETSLIFIEDSFSHAVLKRPVAGDFRVQEEHGGIVRSIDCPAEMIALAQSTLQTAPQSLLYARVDLVELPDGRSAVMELELIEPSLFLKYAPESVDIFAEAIRRRRLTD
ncbi:MAG: hypothetical protein R3C05_17690 [Pirellulaceae bacterium]